VHNRAHHPELYPSNPSVPVKAERSLGRRSSNATNVSRASVQSQGAEQGSIDQDSRDGHSDRRSRRANDEESEGSEISFEPSRISGQSIRHSTPMSGAEVSRLTTRNTAQILKGVTSAWATKALGFDGKAGSSWPEFRQKFLLRQEINEWDDRTAAIQLQLALSGAPLEQVLGDFPTPMRPTLGEFIESVNAWEMFPHTRETQAYDLDHRVRKDGETVLQFARALERLGVRAFGPEEPEMRDFLVRKQFLDGWTRQFTFLGRLKRASRGKPWRELIRLANEIEAEAVHSLRVIRGRENVEDSETMSELLGGLKPSKTKQKAKVEPTKALAAIVEEAEGCPTELAALYGRAGYQGGGGSQGMTYARPNANAQSKSTAKKPATNRKSTAQGDPPREPVLCWKCGGRGHTSRYCHTPSHLALPYKSTEKQPRSDSEQEKEREKRRERNARKRDHDGADAVGGDGTQGAVMPPANANARSGNS
jgi:hypothetical protein